MQEYLQKTIIGLIRQKERSTIICTPSHHDRLFNLLDDVFADVGLAVGEGQLQEIFSGIGRGDYAQRVGVVGIRPHLVIVVARDGGIDEGDGGIGIDVHYISDVVTMRSLGAVA